MSSFKSHRGCPFYGLNMAQIVFAITESEGNQCALIQDSVAPCVMEIRGGTPDWSSCLRNKESKEAESTEVARVAKALKKARSCKFFFRGQEKALSFNEWYESVMGESYKP